MSKQSSGTIYNESGGVSTDTLPVGKIPKWVIRKGGIIFGGSGAVSFGETDAKTRENRDKNNIRKNIVSMEPATKAIINVYKLIPKVSKTGKKYKTELASSSAPEENVSGRSVSGSGRSQPPQEKMRKSYVPGQRWEGYFVDSANDLFLTPDQKKKVKDYAKLNKEHKALERPIREQMRIDRDARESANNAKEQEKNEQNIAEGMKFDENAVKAKGVSEEFYTLLKDERISHETKNNDRWKNDDRYVGISVADALGKHPNNENMTKVMRAIKAAKVANRLTESPPVFITVGGGQTSHRGSNIVYIKKDLAGYRKKKKIHTKVKRPIQSMKKKAPVAHGNKRRVVMKKKGGKR